MIVHAVEQRSPEWRALRAGQFTGTCAAAMLATRKDKAEAAPRRDLRLRLALERITGRAQDEWIFVSGDMRNGAEREPLARAAYEAHSDRIIQTVGYVSLEDLPVGCSPDGYVGAFEGLIEAKAPKDSTHLQYIRDGIVPWEYRPQCLHNVFVTGAAWCDFVSWNPHFPEPLQLFVRRFVADRAELAAYGLMLRQFLAEVDRECDAIRAMVA